MAQPMRSEDPDQHGCPRCGHLLPEPDRHDLDQILASMTMDNPEFRDRTEAWGAWHEADMRCTGRIPPSPITARCTTTCTPGTATDWSATRRSLPPTSSPGDRWEGSRPVHASRPHPGQHRHAGMAGHRRPERHRAARTVSGCVWRSRSCTRAPLPAWTPCWSTRG